MSLFESTSGIPETCVPKPLRRYWSGGVLRLRTEGPPLYVWLGAPVPVALVLGALLALAGVGVKRDVVTLLAASAAAAIGTFVVVSFAYSVRGRIELRWNERAWIVMRQLGPWSRTRTLHASQIRHVERFSGSSFDFVSPGDEGEYLLVHLYRADRPIRVAHGLYLPPDVLDALRQLLANRDGL
jgi:hypothetical protein